MSNCNSDGFAIDQDGFCLEEGVLNSSAPIAIRSDVFQEIMAGSGKEMGGSHLEVDPKGEALPSSSGGIPLEEVVIVEDGYSSDESRLPDVHHLSTTSATVQAIMSTTKYEREALISTRSKLADVLSFLRKKGFSEAQIYEDLGRQGFTSPSPSRDEFGLPVVSNKGVVIGESADCAAKMLDSEGMVGEAAPNPHKDKMKKIEDSPKAASGGVQEPNKDSGKPLWSTVVKNSGPEECGSFDYCLMPEGSSVIAPPPGVLKKGLEKFKLCLVGVFSKGTLPLSKVMELTRKAWDSKGLCQVSQRDSHTFFFKFRSEAEMNTVLARGTWYFERKPLILQVWGADLGVGKPSTVPLWVKFENLPDYYWTREGLSFVASSIGPPICADKVTAQLNPVQFA